MKQNNQEELCDNISRIVFHVFYSWNRSVHFRTVQTTVCKSVGRDSGKLSGLIGVICYVIFFFGIAFSRRWESPMHSPLWAESPIPSWTPV